VAEINAQFFAACSEGQVCADDVDSVGKILIAASVSVGTSLMPRRLAASHRPWPARMAPVSSTKIGLVQKRRMLFIRLAIWLSG
jgi:hypothetical protein